LGKKVRVMGQEVRYIQLSLLCSSASGLFWIVSWNHLVKHSVVLCICTEVTGGFAYE
jgi:hypothetical protein